MAVSPSFLGLIFFVSKQPAPIGLPYGHKHRQSFGRAATPEACSAA